MKLIKVLLALSIFVSLNAMALDGYMAVKGSRSGDFRGESTRRGHEHEVELLEYNFSASTPTDSRTGRTSGQRTYAPVTIVKAWGVTSPLFMNALITNETLSEVTLSFYGVERTGANTLVQKVTLKNARVVSFTQEMLEKVSTDVRGTKTSAMVNVDRIQIVFSGFEMENIPGNTQAGE